MSILVIGYRNRGRVGSNVRPVPSVIPYTRLSYSSDRGIRNPFQYVPFCN